MCGIIAITGGAHPEITLISGLKRLEYRGYDSSGIAIAQADGLNICRAIGKISQLEARVAEKHFSGQSGIGHTRWATHGAPTEANAHPHASSRVAVVHNGIIENHALLREELSSKGYRFHSDTDTEVIPLLITDYLSQKFTPEEAVEKTLARLQGAFALAILFADDPSLLIGARRGSPLAVGYAPDAMLLGSDALALSPFCQKIAYLEEGDMVVLRPDAVQIFNHHGQPVKRTSMPLEKDAAHADKGEYAHFMLKEIFEQPKAITRTLDAYRGDASQGFHFPALKDALGHTSRVTLVACGTSFYAAQVARYWLEQIARVPTSIEIASEFRYRKPIMPEGGLAIFISQSGETADTLAAMRYAQSVGQHTLALVNVPTSSMAREANSVLATMAGPEIGVASTKAFTTQLTALLALTIALGGIRGVLSAQETAEMAKDVAQLPQWIERALGTADTLQQTAKEISAAKDMLFIGRGTSFAIASEGALKMKEISYIHAEGYAAGELKHGPIALIDESVPVVVFAPHDALFEKTASNLQETAARGGRIVLLSNAQGAEELRSLCRHVITLPDCPDILSPMVYAIPAQLLAYYVAVHKGTDVDQPRNLAKSVTVE
ncbi:MAG: glutamine--fructose-6-phosphate transaminase (isomerizing) [Rickettsiales bacterium]|nr:glutamine--fructose-6-phosphate transaminase (isomerizing) [Rickettsiales bacterium]